MKVNFKKTTRLAKTTKLLALAAIIGMVGCSKEEIISNGTITDGNSLIEDNVNNGFKSISLKLVSKTSATRAENNSVSDNEKVVFNNGFLLFASEQYNITKVTAITNQAGANTDSEVDIDLLTDGVTITNVPGHSKYVYVIGNVPVEIQSPATGKSLTALKEELVLYTSQHNIAGVTLFGGKEITLDVPSNKYVAQFELGTLVARLEIGKITSAANSDIDNFQVDGIFINNYYASVSLAGNAPTAVVNNTNTADFVRYSLAYPAADDGILFDYKDPSNLSLGTLADNGRSYTPQTGNAWTYNLLAPKTSSAGSLETPHIVIRLSNIHTTNNVDYNGEWYLTVSGLKVGGDKVTYLEPGKVYHIKNIAFSHANIQPEPEMKTMEVAVEVNLVEWKVSDTDVIFGQE
ncbi:MAG: hypothetical protein LBB84_05925 [Tannerellaceae bacterium]|jgi:hypothetical protein|nr:hypothetical protein [Tannerellaceae bacterium]